jgi:hypothetical protein
VVLTYIKVLSQHLSRKTEENFGIFSQNMVSGLRIKLVSARMLWRNEKLSIYIS